MASSNDADDFSSNPGVPKLSLKMRAANNLSAATLRHLEEARGGPHTYIGYSEILDSVEKFCGDSAAQSALTDQRFVVLMELASGIDRLCKQLTFRAPNLSYLRAFIFSYPRQAAYYLPGELAGSSVPAMRDGITKQEIIQLFLRESMFLHMPVAHCERLPREKVMLNLVLVADVDEGFQLAGAVVKELDILCGQAGRPIQMEYAEMASWTDNEADTAAQAILQYAQYFHGVAEESKLQRLKGADQSLATAWFVDLPNNAIVKEWYLAFRSLCGFAIRKIQLHMTFGPASHNAHADPIRHGGRLVAAKQMVVSLEYEQEFRREAHAHINEAPTEEWRMSVGKVGSAKTAISTPDQNREIRSLNGKVFDAFADDLDESDRAFHEGKRISRREAQVCRLKTMVMEHGLEECISGSVVEAAERNSNSEYEALKDAIVDLKDAIVDFGLEMTDLSKLLTYGTLPALEALFDREKRQALKGAIVDIGLEMTALSKLLTHGIRPAVEALFNKDKREALKDAMLDLDLEPRALSMALTYGNIPEVEALLDAQKRQCLKEDGTAQRWRTAARQVDRALRLVKKPKKFGSVEAYMMAQEQKRKREEEEQENSILIGMLAEAAERTILKQKAPPEERKRRRLDEVEHEIEETAYAIKPGREPAAV